MAPFLSVLLAVPALLSLVSSHYHGEHVKLHEKRLSLDHSKPIDVSGVHQWQAPGAGDQRGPCPGLNALANHGYISRHGVVTLVDVVPVINQVFGMGLDLGTLLATLGVVSGGAPISLAPRVSIGGEDPAVSILLNGLLGIAGKPQGLNLTHNIVEADGSPTRDDLYATGDPVTMNIDTFNEMLALIPEGGSLGKNKMSGFAAKRLHDGIATNPYFYYGPFSGLLARNAAFLFVVNLFSNHSTAYPTGQLTAQTLKSFYGVSENGTYTPGHERIPENWYRRSSDYGLMELNVDVLDWAQRHPVLASIGGNTGSVNSFTPLDLSDISGGAFNAATLLEGNNLLCFALQIVKLAAPTWTNNLFATLAKPLELVLNSLATPLVSLDCPNWTWLQAGGDNILDTLKQYQIPGTDYGLL